MTPAQVISLFSDPETLMRKCFLHIAGGSKSPPPNGQASIQTFSVEIRDDLSVKGFTTGLSGALGLKKSRTWVEIRKLPNAVTTLTSQQFNAFYIPMVQIADADKGSSHYTLPSSGGPSIVITSLLSGCVFSLGSAADGTQLASHVQPSGSTELATKQQLARNAGGQGFSGRYRQLAHGTDYQADQEQLAIIGTRTGTRWQFYAQRRKRSHGSEPSELRSAVKVVE